MTRSSLPARLGARGSLTIACKTTIFQNIAAPIYTVSSRKIMSAEAFRKYSAYEPFELLGGLGGIESADTRIFSPHSAVDIEPLTKATELW
jgi:hypothetical protein